MENSFIDNTNPNLNPYENYFPAQDKILAIEKVWNNQKWNTNNNFHPDTTLKKFYEFLPYHPVSVTSEMIGTSIEELLIHNFPTKRSWECSRLCNFPQELVIRLNYRSHMKFVIIKSKINKPIQEVELYIADGITGNFNDNEYRKLAKAKMINEEGRTIKVDGIGNYLKLVFTRPPFKTIENPCGQVSLAQLKVFGKKINHLLFYDNQSNDNKDNVDRILIDLGLPLNDPYFFINDGNYEIAPVDEDTKITLKDMLLIMRRADVGR
jgi:hypothetical protein